MALYLGGYHKTLNVNPDIADFQKEQQMVLHLGQKHGKKRLNAALESFISSAYWTENIGYAAAIATINYMKK